MKLRWAAALLVLTGLGTAPARADGFGFTMANATVVNNDANHNGKADVNETFTVTNAAFTSYRSSGSAPAILDNDLNRYFATLNGVVAEVSGTSVRYTGTFTITYSGPDLTTDIETGTLDLRAKFDGSGAAKITGTLTANPGSVSSDPKFAATDFSLYNPGRFFGVYTPNSDPATGVITASVNAGNIGFAASLSNGTASNGDENGDGVAEVGETFAMTAPLSTYFYVGAPPLTDNDLNRYSLKFNGTVTSVSGTTVSYAGTFSLVYNDGNLFPTGLTIETGDFTLVADYNEASTGAAKLTATLVAKPGFSTTEAAWANTDYAIFNPATFHGTYVPAAGGKTGIVSGSLIGGVLGFSASIAEGNIVNTDSNGNGRADVGEPFNAGGPLAAYLGIGAPDLQDRDLSRYNLLLSGSVAAVDGVVVTYTGTFTISYANPDLGAAIETGTFSVVATYDAFGNASLKGTLNAKPGAESAVAPFNTTDYAPFNPATFTGQYTVASGGASGALRGGLIGGTMVQAIQSRKLGAMVEGSPTAATRTDDARVAIAASGQTLFVINPATGNDMPGFELGKFLDGKVIGRAAVLKDFAYVATDGGSIYRFNLKTGETISGKPFAAGAKIYTAPAVVDHAISGLAADQLVVSYSLNGASKVAVVPADTLATVTKEASLGSGITTSSPSVPYANRVVVGSNSGVYTLSFPDLVPINSAPVAAVTSPLMVGPAAYLGTGTGQTFSKVNIVNGNVSTVANLGSPLIAGAFYEKRTNLIQAGTADGRIVSFDPAGASVGLTLPGLFNASNTGGSMSMPVETNNLLYRATENREILSGIPLNGDDQQIISVITPVRGALAATGQIPGVDFVLGASTDGILHMIAVR
ncbi:MAG TPA: hypothetical protein VGM37_04020 [Armatimonadota bacterium]